MAVDSRFAELYLEILQEYLQQKHESALSRGYELGRAALVEGLGVLDMAHIHHNVLRCLGDTALLNDSLMGASGDFFAECLSPFEMSRRGAQEGARALLHLNEVMENELKRIAHALHDEAGQLLASVHIAIANIAGELPSSARLRLAEVERLLREIEVELRNLSHDIRPTVLDTLGLTPALECLADNVARRTGLKVLVTGDVGGRLPAAVETALYRIVQEALNNAVKHAQASSVAIALQRTAHEVMCEVHDDGQGFDVHGERAARGLGLIGIRERLNALGGSLRLSSRWQSGTAVHAAIPIRT